MHWRDSRHRLPSNQNVWDKQKLSSRYSVHVCSMVMFCVTYFAPRKFVCHQANLWRHMHKIHKIHSKEVEWITQMEHNSKWCMKRLHIGLASVVHTAIAIFQLHDENKHRHSESCRCSERLGQVQQISEQRWNHCILLGAVWWIEM